MAERNKLVLAGALAEPVDGAVFIFRQVDLGLAGPMVFDGETAPCLLACRNVTSEEIEAFVKADPYVQNGLVPSYSIRP